MHEEAMMILYSKGTFGFWSPYVRNYSFLASPSTNIAARIMDVKFDSYFNPESGQDVHEDKT